LLGTLDAAVGDLNQIKRIVKLMVLVNSAPTFTEQHLVANGASELLAEVFDEKGMHARSAFGVAQVPFGSCVEIELTAEVDECCLRQSLTAIRQFGQEIDRIELVEGPAYGCSITNGVQSPDAGSSFTKPSDDLCVGTLRKLFVIVCTARHSHFVLRAEGKGHERNNRL